MAIYYALGYLSVGERHGRAGDPKGQATEVPALTSTRDVQTCSEGAIAAGERLVCGWTLVSINQRDQEQERVVLLTDKAYYRVKYDFRTSKIEHLSRVPFKNITYLQKGLFKAPGEITSSSKEEASVPHQKHFGLKIYAEFAPDDEATDTLSPKEFEKHAQAESARRYKGMYSWGGLNDDREVFCEVTLQFLRLYLEATGKRLSVLEDPIERKSTVLASSMNALKMGMFHKRSDLQDSQDEGFVKSTGS